MVTLCSVCSASPAVRRGACWGCYQKFRRAGLLDAAGLRPDTSHRFAPSSSVADALRLLVERLHPAARAALHEATRPQNDAPPATPGRVVRHG